MWGHTSASQTGRATQTRPDCPVCSDASKPYHCDDGLCVKHFAECVEHVVDENGMSSGTVVVIVLVVAGVMGGGFFIYWRRAKDKMRSEVRSILAEYMPMDDMDGVGPGDRVGLI